MTEHALCAHTITLLYSQNTQNNTDSAVSRHLSTSGHLPRKWLDPGLSGRLAALRSHQGRVVLHRPGIVELQVLGLGSSVLLAYVSSCGAATGRRFRVAAPAGAALLFLLLQDARLLRSVPPAGRLLAFRVVSAIAPAAAAPFEARALRRQAGAIQGPP